MKQFSIALSGVLLLSACQMTDVDSKASEGGFPDLSASHYGGCILKEPQSVAPIYVYKNGAIKVDNQYAPFTKHKTVYGFTLMAGNEIEDDFLELVGQTIVEMFPQNPSLDLAKQAAALKNNYKYNALIPVPKADELEKLEGRLSDKIHKENSVCDIIMQGSRGQVTEVVEHILHYVNDITLNYAYPKQWGMSKNSLLAQSMREAIEQGYYAIDGYSLEDFGNDEEGFQKLL